MIENKKRFMTGFIMMIAFVVVLIAFFSPIWGGHNGLDYLDNLYNSISKGSAYYIPKIKSEVEAFEGNNVSVTMALADRKQAEQAALLFKAGGARTSVDDASLKVNGDLARIFTNSLDDADLMYYNEGEKVVEKYGYGEKLALYNWWKSFKEMEKDLQRQKKFKEAKAVALVVKKAVESSYNYYGIEPQKISQRFGLVIFSLIFYVIYTMWYGFAFMYMFEGWGMKLGH